MPLYYDEHCKLGMQETTRNANRIRSPDLSVLKLFVCYTDCVRITHWGLFVGQFVTSFLLLFKRFCLDAPSPGQVYNAKHRKYTAKCRKN